MSAERHEKCGNECTDDAQKSHALISKAAILELQCHMRFLLNLVIRSVLCLPVFFVISFSPLSQTGYHTPVPYPQQPPASQPVVFSGVCSFSSHTHLHVVIISPNVILFSVIVCRVCLPLTHPKATLWRRVCPGLLLARSTGSATKIDRH